MNKTYLVEIVHRTARNGGKLIRYKVEAGTGEQACNMVRDMLAIHPRDIMAGYVTADPYKVDRVTA